MSRRKDEEKRKSTEKISSYKRLVTTRVASVGVKPETGLSLEATSCLTHLWRCLHTRDSIKVRSRSYLSDLNGVTTDVRCAGLEMLRGRGCPAVKVGPGFVIARLLRFRGRVACLEQLHYQRDTLRERVLNDNCNTNKRSYESTWACVLVHAVEGMALWQGYVSVLLS